MRKKLSGEKKLMCQIKLFIEKKLSSVVIFLAVEITQVIDSIPWVRCASGNVLDALASLESTLVIKSVTRNFAKVTMQP